MIPTTTPRELKPTDRWHGSRFASNEAIHHYERARVPKAGGASEFSIVELSRLDRERSDHSTLNEFDALDWLQFWLGNSSGDPG